MPFVGTLPALPGSPAGSPTRRVQFSIDFPSEAAAPLFSDANTFWFAAAPQASVMIPNAGATIRVISTSAQDSFMHIQVNGN